MDYLPVIGTIAFIWFLVVTIPGPNFVVVTQGSMRESRKTGLFVALGVTIGAGTWASASLLGLSVLFAYAGWLYDAIKVIGGSYLVYMGMKTIWHAIKQRLPFQSENDVQGTNLAAFQKGLFTSFSNPKTAAFFGSLFISTFPAQAPLWIYVAAVLIVMAVSIVWYWAVACFFSIDKIQLFYKRVKRPLDIMTGLLLSYLGGKLIFGETDSAYIPSG
jgi:threonine/homoserine/homoserine lactone efflux protein